MSSSRTTCASRSGARQDIGEVDDLRQQFLVLGDDLVLLEARETMQAHVEDGLRLGFGEPVATPTSIDVDQAELGADRLGPGGYGAGARQQLRHHTGVPRTTHQACLGLDGRRRRLDQRDHVVDVRQGHGQTFQHVGAIARLCEVENRAPRDDLTAVAHEGFQHLLEREQLRLAVDERDHVDAEHGFERRLREQIVEQHFGDFAALQLDDDAHAVLVGLVAQAVVGDAVYLLFAHQLRDALDEARLVDLVGQLGDDDGLAAADLVDVLEMRTRADRQAAAAGAVRGGDLGGAVDDARGGEVRARHVLHERGQRDLGIVEHRQAGVDDLDEVVRRDVGGHADRDAGRAIDQQVRETAPA